jgi:hypothetical protein
MLHSSAINLVYAKVVLSQVQMVFSVEESYTQTSLYDTQLNVLNLSAYTHLMAYKQYCRYCVVVVLAHASVCVALVKQQQAQRASSMVCSQCSCCTHRRALYIPSTTCHDGSESEIVCVVLYCCFDS